MACWFLFSYCPFVAEKCPIAADLWGCSGQHMLPQAMLPLLAPSRKLGQCRNCWVSLWHDLLYSTFMVDFASYLCLLECIPPKKSHPKRGFESRGRGLSPLLLQHRNLAGWGLLCGRAGSWSQGKMDFFQAEMDRTGRSFEDWTPKMSRLRTTICFQDELRPEFFLGTPTVFYLFQNFT